MKDVTWTTEEVRRIAKAHGRWAMQLGVIIGIVAGFALGVAWACVTDFPELICQ